MKKKRKEKKSHVPVRMNILFFAVFVLFSILIMRLGIVQIVEGADYRAQVERKDEISVNQSVPRGLIYDRDYQLLAYNVPMKAITYTPPKNPRQEDLLELAKKLAKIIDMGPEAKEKVPEWVLKDIWQLENDGGKDKLTASEKKNLDEKEGNKVIRQRITEEELSPIDRNVAAIYEKLARAVALTPTIIKSEGVTDEEYARVAEQLADLPGVDITTYWKREKTNEDVFFLLGQINEGLPAEKVDYYLSKGYSLNDRVGKSYLEELLEDVLRGSKAVVKNVTDKNGNIVKTETISEGKSGYDVVLTIDEDFQAAVEQIIEEEILNMRKYPAAWTLDSAFVVAMNPKTGEILALAGKKYDTEKKEFYDYSNGTFTYAFAPGSAVKGATVLMGYANGVISPGSVHYDAPMDIGGDTIASVQTMHNINDLTALERSSNVYMAKVVLAITGGTYSPGKIRNVNPEKLDTLRYYFAQFGLGVKTGIGFSNETEGLHNKLQPGILGPILYFGFGQFDTYTPIQLAQYVSTIANDGYRMKPQLVKEVREPGVDGQLGNLLYEMEPVVLNRVDMKQEWIDRVKYGFWLVTHGSAGTARAYFSNEPYNAAGKTGTAEAFYVKNGKTYQTYNLTFVGFAPYDNPEIAIAVVAPNAYVQGQKQPYSISNIISQRVFRKYFELKAQKGSGAENAAENGTEENGE